MEFSRIKIPKVVKKKMKQQIPAKKPPKKKIKKDYDSDNFSLMGDDYLAAGRIPTGTYI